MPSQVPRKLSGHLQKDDVEGAIKEMRQEFLRAISVWLLIMLAEIVHGIIRAIFLVPVVGEFRSDQIGVLSGSLIVMVIAVLTIRWIDLRKSSELLACGLLWLVLTVAFEFSFGGLVLQMNWTELTASYRIWQGGLMPLGLLVLVLSPLIANRLRPKSRLNHSDA